jgi:hypothetical protein
MLMLLLTNFKLRFVFGLLIVAMLLFIPQGLSALSVPGHLLDVQWSTPSNPGYDEMSVDVKVEKLEGNHGYYYANTIYLNGVNSANLEPNIMYAGFQNIGYTGANWIGNMAIFSVWGALSGTSEPSGWGTSFGGEGTGYSVRIPYTWAVGTSYAIIIRITGQDATNYIYSGYIRNNSSGVETKIGTIPVLKGRGKMYSPISFHEIYGFNNNSPASCDALSSSVVTFSNARAENTVLSPYVYYVNPYTECPGRNTDVNISGGTRSIFDSKPVIVEAPVASPKAVLVPRPVVIPAKPTTPVAQKPSVTPTPASIAAPVIVEQSAKPDKSANQESKVYPSTAKKKTNAVKVALGISAVAVTAFLATVLIVKATRKKRRSQLHGY